MLIVLLAAWCVSHLEHFDLAGTTALKGWGGVGIAVAIAASMLSPAHSVAHDKADGRLGTVRSWMVLGVIVLYVAGLLMVLPLSF